MPCKIKNEYGTISVETEVVSRIAGLAAMECYGVVGMAAKSMKDGFAQLLKKESLTKGIFLTAEDNTVTLELHIIVLYGTSIAVIGESLTSSVKYKVEEMTGLAVNAVNIFVDGVRLD